jgi:hypothetical protein
MPDLLVYDKDRKQPYFCEVKFRSQNISEIRLPIQHLTWYKKYWQDSIIALVVPSEHTFYAQHVANLKVEAESESRNQIFDVRKSFDRLEEIFTNVRTETLNEYRDYLSKFKSMNGTSPSKLNIMMQSTISFQLEDQA